MEIKEKKFGLKEYNEIHNRVLEYQKGDVTSGEYVIEEFRGFINKFIQLIKYGRYELENFSIRNFILLYAESPQIKTVIKQHNYNKIGAKTAVSSTVGIITSVFESSDVEDIENDLICILLTMCKKYKDTKPSFHNHVKRNFHFYAFRYFEKLSRDPIARRFTVTKVFNNRVHKDNATDSIYSFDIIDCMVDEDIEKELEAIDSSINVYYDLRMSDTQAISSDSLSIFEDEFLDDNWINGITCSPIFKPLSVMERHIIVCWYVHGMTDSDISEFYGVCRGTINKKRLRTKNRLAEIMKKHKVYISDKETK